jgi:hypothetical protein
MRLIEIIGFIVMQKKQFTTWCLILLSMLLLGACGENNKNKMKTADLAQVTDKLYHITLYRIHIVLCAGFELTTLVVLGTDCIQTFNGFLYF